MAIRFLLWQRFTAKMLVLAIATASVLVAAHTISAQTGRETAIAQIIRPDGVGQKVYEQLPELPKENQYINKETGKVAEADTLVSRLVRYHLYSKGRPPFHRLDWKLTLADYLGLSGQLDDADYPGGKNLNKNPMDGDLSAIRKLDRAQRNALVQALVDAFAPQSRTPQPVPKPVIQLPSRSK